MMRAAITPTIHTPTAYLLVTAMHDGELISLLCEDVLEVLDLPPFIRVLAVSLIILIPSKD